MLPLLLILLPLVLGLICFAMKGAAKGLALGVAAVLAGVSIYVAFVAKGGPLGFQAVWLPQLGATFTLFGDGLSTTLTALTGIVLLSTMIAQQNKEVESPGAFYGLLLLSVAGINGVFLAADGLLFYFFWELALVPVYFLCSRWGGERRIPVTFKFFVYTFVGSLMMLAGLIYLYLHTTGGLAIASGHSYAIVDMKTAALALPATTQAWLFPLIFIAFAIKMPIFPFHTWQPDTYETSPTPVTIVLSALMVKMGVYATIRWALPVLQDVELKMQYSNIITTLSITGIVYASCIAMMQSDVKRLIAYSSIAHMGLICAGVFAGTQPAMQGVVVQMFNHGISITGMWLLAGFVESRYGTRDMTKFGGLATVAPWMSIALLIVAFANIALPLTNGFVGEFMLFHGLFESASQYHVVFMAVAGLGVILGAVYTLTMVQKVAYGNTAEGITTTDLTINEWCALAVIISLILFLGIYPQPLLA